MKIRTFTFTPDADGRADFRLASETVRSRDPEKCTGTERQWIEQLQRALLTVSEPIGDLPEDYEIDARPRKLQPGGGTITITQKAHEKLESYLEEAKIQSMFVIAAADFRDRWGQAEKGDRDETPAKKSGPVAVEKAG